MKVKTILAVFLAVLLIAPAFAGSIKEFKSNTFSPIVGEWRGMTKCNLPHLTDNLKKVVLFIRDDKTVTGKVGELTLKNGKIDCLTGRNRTRLQEEWLVTGDVEGVLNQADGSGQYHIEFPLNFKGTAGEGRMKTSGVKNGKTINSVWHFTYLNKYLTR